MILKFQRALGTTEMVASYFMELELSSRVMRYVVPTWKHAEKRKNTFAFPDVNLQKCTLADNSVSLTCAQY